MEQELLTLLNQPNSPPVCSGVRVAQSLVSLLCLMDHCLSVYVYYFDHRRLVYPSVIFPLVSSILSD